MKIEEISPHAHSLYGSAAVFRTDRDGVLAMVGVDIQAAALRRLQRLLLHSALKALAEREDIPLRLAAVHREIAGQLGIAGLPCAPEPSGGGQGTERAADLLQPGGTPYRRQHQHNIENQQEPLLEAEFFDRRQHPPGQLSQMPHDGFSTIRTWLPASSGLLEVVMT